MSDQSPASWAELFEGKTSAQILWTEPPDGLSESESLRFRAARMRASNAAWETEKAAGEQAKGDTQIAEPPASPEPELPPATLSADAEPISVDKRHFGPYADRAPPADADLEPIDSPPAAPVVDPIPLIIPMGRCEELLERQLASGAGLVEHLVQYIARYDSEVSACLQFADRICSVMKSSAGLAKAVGRLRGLGPEETRHRVFVEYAPHGGGVLRT